MSELKNTYASSSVIGSSCLTSSLQVKGGRSTLVFAMLSAPEILSKTSCLGDNDFFVRFATNTPCEDSTSRGGHCRHMPCNCTPNFQKDQDRRQGLELCCNTIQWHISRRRGSRWEIQHVFPIVNPPSFAPPQWSPAEFRRMQREDWNRF